MLCPAQFLGTAQTTQQSAGPFSQMARLPQVRLPGAAEGASQVDGKSSLGDQTRPYNTTSQSPFSS
jgi:hypothetical protein